jgi:hypothetical protein
MICNPPQTNYFFHDCSECPGPTNLDNTLEDVFTDNGIENITFKQWILTDRCELVTTVKSMKHKGFTGTMHKPPSIHL